jgi:hypothetical protein
MNRIFQKLGIRISDFPFYICTENVSIIILTLCKKN